MSLANKITVARAVLIAPVICFLFLGQREAALALFLVACAGDVLDGMVARSRGEITAMGKALDPLVDKALYVALLASLAVLSDIPSIALILFLIPEIGLVVGGIVVHRRAGIIQGARIPGKAAAVLFFASMVLLLLRVPGRMEVLYTAIGASYLAALDYLRIAIQAKGVQNTDNRETVAELATESEPASQLQDE